ncbi:MAG TPA: efflux RND transporter periplasmic adaptor subunit [Quisquiliibacterium sp.]|nr:efflux RND transporter periplasmic adaptor subunit [Quisquiliibacterium sp.]
MIGRRWLLVVGVLVAAAAAAFVLVPRSTAVDVVSVRRGPLTQTVVATGRVATPARIAVASQLAARIEQVTVREGAAVQAGQVLVRLRSDEAESALNAALAAEREARGRIRALGAVAAPVSEQQLVQAQAALQLAEQEAGRTRALLARGFVSQARVDEAERALASARAAALAARAQAEGNRAGGVEAELAATRLAQAQANVAAARARLELLVLRAPAAAVVLTRTAEPGDIAQVGRTLLELAQSGETRVIASVDEKNLAHMRDGLAAAVMADAFPGRRFDATVFYVAPAVDAQRGTVEVRLRVPAPPDFLKPDMTVSVEMRVGRRDDALMLPAQAIRGADGDTAHVMAMRGERVEKVPVTLGLRGVGSVEIASGLKEGDAVILPGTAVTEGDRVRVRARAPAKGNMQSSPFGN